MQAHRKDDSGNFYDLDLTDPTNESRNLILINAQNKFVPLFCRHCDNPECVSSCMSGALVKNSVCGLVKDPVSGLVKDSAGGLVHYDADKCAACFMCVMNCPYGVIKPDTTKTKVIRCDFCAQRGGEPSCVKVCRSEAIYVQEV